MIRKAKSFLDSPWKFQCASHWSKLSHREPAGWIFSIKRVAQWDSVRKEGGKDGHGSATGSICHIGSVLGMQNVNTYGPSHIGHAAWSRKTTFHQNMHVVGGVVGYRQGRRVSGLPEGAGVSVTKMSLGLWDRGQ